MITYQIEDRLREYLNSINMSVYQLEMDCGFARSYFTNSHFNVPDDKLEVILHYLPDLNKEWLLTGEGEMSNGRPITERIEPLSAKAKEEQKNRRRQIMERVGEVIMTQLAPTIEQYEKKYHVLRGTYQRAVKRGDDRVVEGWASAVYKESNYLYSYDWIMTGEGPRYRIRRGCLPILHASTLEERFNTTNRLIKSLDKDWLDYYATDPDVQVDIISGFDNADFAVLFDDSEEPTNRQYLCQVVTDLSTMPREGKFILCDRMNGIRIGALEYRDSDVVGIHYQDGSNVEEDGIHLLREYSIVAKVVGVVEHTT